MFIDTSSLKFYKNYFNSMSPGIKRKPFLSKLLNVSIKEDAEKLYRARDELKILNRDFIENGLKFFNKKDTIKIDPDTRVSVELDFKNQLLFISKNKLFSAYPNIVEMLNEDDTIKIGSLKKYWQAKLELLHAEDSKYFEGLFFITTIFNKVENGTMDVEWRKVIKLFQFILILRLFGNAGIVTEKVLSFKKELYALVDTTLPDDIFDNPARIREYFSDHQWRLSSLSLPFFGLYSSDQITEFNSTINFYGVATAEDQGSFLPNIINAKQLLFRNNNFSELFKAADDVSKLLDLEELTKMILIDSASADSIVKLMLERAIEHI